MNNRYVSSSEADKFTFPLVTTYTSEKYELSPSLDKIDLFIHKKGLSCIIYHRLYNDNKDLLFFSVLRYKVYLMLAIKPHNMFIYHILSILSMICILQKS